MPEYRVRWEIDVDADTPEEAAREALAIQRRQPSEASVFTVTDRARFTLGRAGEHRPSTVEVDLGWQ
jgi:hypothetical protein